MLLEGKRAIVTGGSRGIGRGIAVEFARQGADVVINYFGGADSGFSRDKAADETVAEIEALGRKAIAIEGNIAEPAVSTELVQAAVDAFGGVDILASNAGICPFHTFLDMLGWLKEYHTEMLIWTGKEKYTLTEHEEIVDRIEQRDPEGAEKSMIKHLERSRALYVMNSEK